MIKIQNRITGVLYGLTAGDRIGGPLRMALCLSRSLIEKRGFDLENIFSTYSNWYHEAGFDTGPTAARVFNFVAQGMSIEEVVISVDQRAQGMIAGCNPMHRAIVLACCMDIPENELLNIARQEAKLTHYHHLAGDVSATTVLLCRKLINGESLETTLNELDTQDWLNRSISRGGFAPDVFATTIHFLRSGHDFQTVLANALGFAGGANYSPVTVGALAGAILWC